MQRRFAKLQMKAEDEGKVKDIVDNLLYYAKNDSLMNALWCEEDTHYLARYLPSLFNPDSLNLCFFSFTDL